MHATTSVWPACRYTPDTCRHRTPTTTHHLHGILKTRAADTVVAKHTSFHRSNRQMTEHRTKGEPQLRDTAFTHHNHALQHDEEYAHLPQLVRRSLQHCLPAAHLSRLQANWFELVKLNCWTGQCGMAEPACSSAALERVC